jgi:hypothetical protein
MSTYLPTKRQTIALAMIGMLSIIYALYLRYGLIENTPIGLACDAGEISVRCIQRTVIVALDQSGFLGYAAAGAAILMVIRPQFVMFAIALIFTGLGLVLHNAGLAGLAGGLLVISLARPAPPSEWQPDQPPPHRTTTPAS